MGPSKCNSKCSCKKEHTSRYHDVINIKSCNKYRISEILFPSSLPWMNHGRNEMHHGFNIWVKGQGSSQIFFSFRILFPIFLLSCPSQEHFGKGFIPVLGTSLRSVCTKQVTPRLTLGLV